MAASLIVETVETDVLVLGAGVAGLRAAIAARQAGLEVLVVHKAQGASPFLLGCNAPLGPDDSPERYANDVIAGGGDLNDRRLVHVLAGKAEQGVRDLLDLGVPLERRDCRIALRHLSGNSVPRSVFVPSGTGKAFLERLAARSAALGVTERRGGAVLSLLHAEGTVVGALVWSKRSGKIAAVRAGATVLALGGMGRLYEDSTYPGDVAASSYALAAAVGASLVDLEFVQFEPTIVVHPAGCKGMEMPTAMLGDGAHLLNRDGERFMFRPNPEHGERHVEKARLALCIQDEIDAGRGFPDDTVEFDATVLRPALLEGYVGHCARLRQAGVDPARERPRVRPAAHSHMGGVAIDETGWTGVPGLFAGGEATGGLHGASRLAGNSGSDALVFGDVAGRSAAGARSRPDDRIWARAIAAAEENLLVLGAKPRSCDAEAMAVAIGRIMRSHVGLRRNGPGLEQAKAALGDLRASVMASGTGGDPGTLAGLLQLQAAVTVAAMIAAAASARTESRGAHQRLDFPGRDDEHWRRHVACRLGQGGDILVETRPVC